GEIGHAIALKMLQDKGVQMDGKLFNDCGIMIYEDDQPVQSGASGTASSAVVTFGHLYHMQKRRTIKRILLVATASLHSTLSVQQKQSLPCVAHAVSIETKEGML